MARQLNYVFFLLFFSLWGGKCSAQMLLSERMRLCDSLATVANTLWEQESYEESTERTREMCALFADLHDGNNLQHAQCLYLLALRQKALENYADACESAKKSLTIFESVLPFPMANDIEAARLCEKCFRLAGDLSAAVEYGEKAIAKQDMIKAPRDSLYAWDLYQLGQDYFNNSNYAQANENFARFVSVVGNSADGLGYDLDFLAITVTLMGRGSYELEDFDRAIAYFSLADSIFCEEEGLEAEAVATKNFLGLLYARTDPELAAAYYDEAERIYFDHIDEYRGSLKSIILRIWNNKAALYGDAEPREALDVYNHILEYYDSGNATPDDIYAMTLCNKSYCLAMIDDSLDVALQASDQALRYMEEHGYDRVQTYLDALSARSFVVMQLGDAALIEEHAAKLYGHISSQLTQNFPTLGEEERASYWNKVSGWYTCLLPTMTLLYPTERMAELCYNGMLQSKGILLNSTVNIDRLLKESENPELISIRKQWAESKERLQKSVAGNDSYEADRAQRVVRSLERRILKMVAAYGNFMDDLDISAADVKKAMGENDLAVEFLCSTNVFTTDTTYIALTLKKDYTAPHIIVLGSGEQLDSLANSATYGGLGDALYSHIWQPILEDAGNAPENVYFSADGLFYNLPLEYCATPDGGLMLEKCHCYRVSSTREIAKQEKTAPAASDGKGSVVLYGNIDYNAGLAAMELANSQTRAQYGEEEWQPQSLLASRSLDERGGARRIAKLEGTRQEISSIAGIFRENGLVPVVFDSCRATKESLKMVAHGKLRLLHIATHGIYVSHGDEGRYSWLITQPQETDDTPTSQEDRMLSRSALVMAGINMYVAQKQGQADALLTAQEISLLNLTGLDLAVLSACETALGDVSGEGVFGLQRGFKKAGAKSLLMSLMKVNDHATMLFMQHFYQQLVAGGKTKYDSLLDTIRFIRSTENGRWNKPQYWASFILLDGNKE